MKGRLFLFGILIVACLSMVGGWSHSNREQRFRENTEFTAGFSEDAFNKVEEGVPVDSVLSSLGKPLAATVSRPGTTAHGLLDGIGDWRKYPSLFHYSVSRDGTDHYLVRRIAVTNGRVHYKQSFTGEE